MNVCRILVGILFIYSGFVKGVDPLGSTYKFTDYFLAFGMNWMTPTALFFSFLLALTEFTIGACLFLNIKTKWAIWGALLFMAFFTPLTLILAIKNPVTDCGCFGDALILTNWETFWKNIALSIITLFLFYKKKQFKSWFNFLEQTIMLVSAIVFILCIESHSYRHLPIIDFRPYATGKNISEGMKVPEGAPLDEYRITLQYKNKHTGEIKDFTEADYPWQDSLNWVFHDSKEKLIKEGYKPEIHGFTIEHPTLGNITEELLQNSDYTFLVIAYNINKTNPASQEKLNRLAAYAQEKGYSFYCLSASGPDDIKKYTTAHPANYEFCTSDEILLKTMIRSNPGLMLLRSGTILDKWGYRDIPEVDEIKDKDLASFCLLQQQYQTDKYMIYSLFLAVSCCLLLYTVRKYRKQVK